MDSSKQSKNQLDLFEAAKNGQTETIKALISAADVFINAKDSDGDTALILSVQGGHTETVKFLLSVSGIQINEKNLAGDTALIYAAFLDNVKMVKVLLSMPDILINEQNFQGDTALILSARYNCFSVVKLLTQDERTNLYAVNLNKLNALEVANRPEHAGVALHLMSHMTALQVSNIKRYKPRLFVSLFPYSQQIAEFKFQIFKKIFQMQQHPNPKINPLNENLMIKIFSFLTPDWYSEKQFPKMYQEQKNKIPKVIQKLQLNNLLLEAAQIGNVDAVKTYLQAGARISYTKDNQSALKLALEREDAATNIRIELIDADADVKTELDLAIEHQNINIIKKLMLAGINVNINLNKAIKDGQINTVKTLINAGVDLNTADGKGYTALDHAIAYSKYKIILLLLIAKTKNLYAEFKKQPAYYLFSGTVRLAIGALVSYGLFHFYAGPYLASAVQPALNTLGTWALIGVIPKSFTVLSAIAGLMASKFIGNVFLSHLFGEIKLNTKVSQNYAAVGRHTVDTSVTKTKGLLALLGQNKPYVPTVCEITQQLEQAFNQENKHCLPDILEKSKIFSFAYTREIVNSPNFNAIFDDKAKAEVNAEPYASAKLESIKKRA
jgi:ankyrin repeat protein